jgi:hypothetical protein
MDKYSALSNKLTGLIVYKESMEWEYLQAYFGGDSQQCLDELMNEVHETQKEIDDISLRVNLL